MADAVPQGPSIVLIGGQITLDSGVSVDSRRQIAGDEWDFTLRTALGVSEAFWYKAKTLTDMILDQDDSPNAWAFAWVNKTIKRPKADGTFTRVRSVKYLDDADHLMDKLLLQGNATIRAQALKARYRIMPYFLRFEDVVSSTHPAAFVGSFHTTYDDGTDIVGLAPLSYVLSRWPSAVLVLPHTPLIEKKARDVLEWHRNGAASPKRDEYGSVGLAQYTNPLEAGKYIAAHEATAEIRAADPYAIADDLRISFWADGGQIREAADLDAALNFVMSRYDLDIGLWDLARDPVLRMSLLEPEEQEPVAESPAPIPQELVAAATERTALRQQAKVSEQTARESLHSVLWPDLERLGWIVPPWKQPGTEYRFGVGPQVRSPNPEVPTELALFFMLIVHKKQATLNLFAMTRIEATAEFLTSNADDIARITTLRPEPDTNTVARFPNAGWDGSHEEWVQNLRVVQACVDLLTPRLDDLIDVAVEMQEHQLAQRSPFEVTITVEEEQPRIAEPKRSLWSKVFGSD